jgi:predicted Zn-ribbon and HTH transcriptional regulator
MSWIKRLIAHCDICGHEWIPTVKEPVHCAKCKSRRWNENAASRSKVTPER